MELYEIVFWEGFTFMNNSLDRAYKEATKSDDKEWLKRIREKKAELSRAADDFRTIIGNK